MTAAPPPVPAAPSAPPSLAVEDTAIGAQTLVPGVVPITLADRLAWRAAQPLGPRKPQKPCDDGLFDLNARLQLSLFDPLPPPDPGGG